MKKLLIVTIAAMLLMISLPLPARVIISDEDMDDVTAEEGVSVQFVNMTVSGTTLADELSWGDTGFGTTYTSAGFIGAKNVTITGNLTTLSGVANVDVGSNGSATRVALVLPTITLGTVNVDATLKVSGNKELTGGKTLGILNMVGFSTNVGGSVQVYSH